MMTDKRFLITTALEDTWVDDHPVLFLGEWCRIYSRRARWSKMNAEVLPYHWDDRDKFYYDYQYLNDFYERVLGDLAIRLNSIHGTAHGLRYWRILIGPWLAYFVQILFDRWLSIHAALSHFDIEGSIVITGNDDALVPNDMTHFSELMIGDEWNHHLYAGILARFGKTPLLKKTYAGDNNTRSAINKFSVKARFGTVLAKIASCLVRDCDAFLISTYLPFFSKIRLYFRLRQIPWWWRSVAAVSGALDWQQRNWEMPDSGRTDFERFLLVMIPKQIPVCYLEGYQQLLDQTHNLPWPKSPKLIYTANALWHDSVCMAYTAEKTEQGTVLVYGQHGGGYGTAKFHFAEDHEIEISDRYLTWGWSGDSAGKISPTGIAKAGGSVHNPANSKTVLLFIAMSTSRYSFRLCAESAINYQNYIDRTFSFVAAVNERILPNFLARLSPADNGRCQSMRWHDRFPNIKLDPGRRNIYGLIKEARVVVLTYNQTAILETLALGIPSVLFCDLNVTPLRDSAVPYFDALRRVGIFHDTPESAAAHVNKVWDDVDAWWTSADVQEVLACFKRQYCHHPESILDCVESVLRDATSHQAI